jgi:eukaryotic-like serine/threonine-protein kinase
VETDISRCGKCGAGVLPSEAEGLCPRCLMDMAIAGQTWNTGDRVGPYEILSFVSLGGMGEVYRASDTRLDRTVAIKFLSPSALDLARRERFKHEARAVSSLNHPNICSLYDVGEQDDSPFFVMEYVEGETLARRLVGGALPIEQVLRCAIEIAEALDHAHSHGIIHRDLKPANVMLTGGGVKLLDFGVAKSQRVIDDGTVVGTLQYMAPEQLDGRETDARTDVFSVGAVIYEMTTGQPAFTASSRTALKAAILDHEPPSCSSVRVEVPAALDTIVKRCLEKRPEDRWQSVGDLKHALAEIKNGRRTNRRWVAAAAILASLTAITFAITASRNTPTTSPSFRFVVSPPGNASFNQSSAFMAISPDGHSLAFVASTSDGNDTLWVRALDSLTARQLPGTSGSSRPFWSADSRSVTFGVFGAPETLKKVDVTGGLPETITGSRAMPGAWNDDGVMLLATSPQDGGVLQKLSPQGGPALPVTSLDLARGETSHIWPQFLPDGRRFIFLARSEQAEHDGVTYVGSLDSPDRVRLVSADSHATYAPQGYLLLMQANTLVAQAFDAKTLQLSGDPISIAEQVERTPGTFRGAFSISRTGVLAYRPIEETQLAWYDRTGRELQSIGTPGPYSNPALSPDEERIAVGRLDFKTGTSDIWVIDLARGGIASQLTFDVTAETTPLWWPDGRRIIFRSPTGLYERTASGIGNEAPMLLRKVPPVGYALDWWNDGQALIYHSRSRKTGLDVWMLPTAGDRTPIPLLQTEFQEGYARLSRDGRWMVYVSNKSGTHEVYVRAFPSGDGERQISTKGGFEPAWSADGKELFYLAPDRTLMSVAVNGTSTLETGLPSRLFETRMSVAFNPSYTRNQYMVSADGQRFLINQPPVSAPSPPITVVVNWPAALKLPGE